MRKRGEVMVTGGEKEPIQGETARCGAGKYCNILNKEKGTYIHRAKLAQLKYCYVTLPN